MPHSATAALGALSLHPAPLMQGSDSPSAGGMGRKGRHRQAPGLLFFTLRKNAGEGGEEGSKFLSLCYHSCLAKRKLRKPFGRGKAGGAALAEEGWGHEWQWEYLPCLEAEGLVLTCCEPFGL